MRIFKRKIIWIPTLTIAVVVAGYFLFRGSPPNPEFVTARRGTVIQEVSFTGKTKAAQAVELDFERGGRVVRLPVDTSGRVAVGAVVAELDSREAVAELARARAAVEVQRSRLAELRRGTRPEELSVAEAKRANAAQGLRDAERSLADKILDAYAKADDAVRYRTDPVFTDPRSSNPRFNFILTDPTLAPKLEQGRRSIEATLSDWQARLVSLGAGAEPLSSLSLAQENLRLVAAFLDTVAAAVNSLTATDNLSQTAIDGYRLSASTARANANAAAVNLSAAAEARNAALANVTLAGEELALKQAGATSEAVASQEAQVREAGANAAALEAQMEKYVLRSPIAGVVTKRTAEVGETVAANAPVIAVISTNLFEIEANVSEVDIAKLKVGQAARITLDAYGGDVPFNARISAVDPGETVIDGVPTYRVTLHFDESDERIRSGMTANIDVVTATREDVIVLPQRAIDTQDGKRVVRIWGEKVIRIVRAQTGLRGLDGNVEVLSGVHEGERVLIPES